MYTKIKNKKIEIEELISFKQRFKSLRFNFNKLDHIVKIPNKRVISTLFFVQYYDLVITNKNEVIIYIEESIMQDKYFVHKKGGSNFYFLPKGLIKYLKVGDIFMNYKD